VDPDPLRIENPAKAFLPFDEPRGMIEATLRRLTLVEKMCVAQKLADIFQLQF
jgi:hypothetical protein